MVKKSPTTDQVFNSIETINEVLLKALQSHKENEDLQAISHLKQASLFVDLLTEQIQNNITKTSLPTLHFDDIVKMEDINSSKVEYLK